jgi:hypothetical protein
VLACRHAIEITRTMDWIKPMPGVSSIQQHPLLEQCLSSYC